MAFRPDICDLCGSSAYETLLDMRRPTSLRSDRALATEPLRKLACAACGLVRSGRPLSPDALVAYYEDDYALSVHPEHFFYTPHGPQARSVVLADWLTQETGAECWQSARRALEVGAGAGRLMAELHRRFPGVDLEGLEPGRQAAQAGREAGLAVRTGSLEALEKESYDLAYSVAVVEHVASPTDWLRALRSCLRSGARLVLCQPTQDVPSYDLFFIDHLHHFGTEHLRQYARKCGFHERHHAVGHPLMPNFSVHVWEVLEPAATFAWEGPPCRTRCEAASVAILEDLRRLDAMLDALQRQARPVAVFGLGEAYWVARCYSRLGEFPVACGLDDAPDRPEYAGLGFPVLRPEECLRLGVTDVILAMNAMYYPMAQARLSKLGLRSHPVFAFAGREG
jgi:SAM-dependent methyltransferase